MVDFQDVKVFTGGAPRDFQIWIQFFPVEKVTFTFGPDMGAGDPQGLNTGAENRTGTSGVNVSPLPLTANSSMTVNIGPPTPGGKVTITYDALGRNAGVHDILASLSSNIVQGVTTDRETITVTK